MAAAADQKKEFRHAQRFVLLDAVPGRAANTSLDDRPNKSVGPLMHDDPVTPDVALEGLTE